MSTKQFNAEHRERVRAIFQQITRDGERKFQGFANPRTRESWSDSVPEWENKLLFNNDGETLTLYTDGSYFCEGEFAGLSAAAVAYANPKAPSGWETESKQLGRYVGNNNDAEMFGILLALRIALRQLKSGRNIKNIIICSDSKECIQVLEPKLHTDVKFTRILGPLPQNGKWALEEILEISEQIPSGIYVHVRWIRGHANMIGNEVADRAASEANRAQGRYLPPHNANVPLPSIPLCYSRYGSEIALEYLYRLSMPWISFGSGICHLQTPVANLAPQPQLSKVDREIVEFIESIKVRFSVYYDRIFTDIL
jgi:ribonuclease HI